MFNQPDEGDREAEKQNLVMKTVIALQGRSNTGKTETLNWLIDKLVEHGMAVTEQDPLLPTDLLSARTER